LFNNLQLLGELRLFNNFWNKHPLLAAQENTEWNSMDGVVYEHPSCPNVQIHFHELHFPRKEEVEAVLENPIVSAFQHLIGSGRHLFIWDIETHTDGDKQWEKDPSFSLRLKSRIGDTQNRLQYAVGLCYNPVTALLDEQGTLVTKDQEDQCLNLWLRS